MKGEFALLLLLIVHFYWLRPILSVLLLGVLSSIFWLIACVFAWQLSDFTFWVMGFLLGENFYRCRSRYPLRAGVAGYSLGFCLNAGRGCCFALQEAGRGRLEGVIA